MGSLCEFGGLGVSCLQGGFEVGRGGKWISVWHGVGEIRLSREEDGYQGNRSRARWGGRESRSSITEEHVGYLKRSQRNWKHDFGRSREFASDSSDVTRQEIRRHICLRGFGAREGNV